MHLARDDELEGNPVRYMMLVFETDADMEAMHTPGTVQDPLGGAWRAYVKALVDAGVYVSGHALMPTTSATTVRIDDGKRRVQDGPFADSREQLGGFIMLELGSLEEALDWAARCPAAAYATIEVRPALVDPSRASRVPQP